MIGCRNPFNILYILVNGFATCCQSWVDKSNVLKLTEYSPFEMWNCEQFLDLREKVIAGNWSSCKGCVRLASKIVPEEITTDSKPVMNRGPLRIILANDLMCNLHCKSCRPKHIGIKPGHKSREKLMLEMLDAFLPACKVVTLLQSGEVFASPMHIRWLESINHKRYSKLKIKITTNGILMPSRWAKIKNAWPLIDSMSISVDAATQNIYKRVRGGRWKSLLDSLVFTSRLRFNEMIRHFQINFCVQSGNYQDIPAFIKMGKTFGVDKVKFTMLRPGWRSSSEFNKYSVANERHKDRKPFLEICNSGCLDDPTVDAEQLLGTLHTNIYHTA